MRKVIQFYDKGTGSPAGGCGVERPTEAELDEALAELQEQNPGLRLEEIPDDGRPILYSPITGTFPIEQEVVEPTPEQPAPEVTTPPSTEVPVEPAQ